jgi:hypothetical protein
MEIRQAAESIRLMYEDRNNQSGIAEAKELIKAAQCVCFLGFGFDPDNIDRLELGNCCTPPPTGILDPGLTAAFLCKCIRSKVAFRPIPA